MVVRLHEIIDCEVIFAIVESRTASNDLLELDHRIDRAHQHNIADVPGVYAGGEFLRSGEYSWNGFLVILKIA